MDTETRAAITAMGDTILARMDRYFEIQQVQHVELRAELRGGLADVRGEIADVRREIAELRAAGRQRADITGEACGVDGRPTLTQPAQHVGRRLVERRDHRLAQDLLQVVVVVLDRLAPVLAVGVLVVEVRPHRTRPVQRHEGGHVLDGPPNLRAVRAVCGGVTWIMSSR